MGDEEVEETELFDTDFEDSEGDFDDEIIVDVNCKNYYISLSFYK
jgi:hypothetical protein